MEVKYAIARLDGSTLLCRTIDSDWVSDVNSSDIDWYETEENAKSKLRGYDHFVFPKCHVTLEDKLSILKDLCDSIHYASNVCGVDVGAVNVPGELFHSSSVVDVRDYDTFISGILPGTNITLITTRRN